MQRDRALHHLRAIRRDVDRLTALRAAWFDDSFLADDRIGYRAEWSNALDRFSSVVRAHASQELDADVSAELIGVAKLLVRFSPSLERMQLRQPSPDDLRRLGILSAA
jgi:hypothetical protein